MLSQSEIKSIAQPHLTAYLQASIKAATDAVSAPVSTVSDEPVPWNDTTIDQFKRQAPGSILFMTDGTVAYAPPGNNTVRGPTGTTELEIRLSSDGGDKGTWKSVAGISSSIDKVAWGCCTSNNKSGVFADGLNQGGIAVGLRPDIVKRGCSIG